MSDEVAILVVMAVCAGLYGMSTATQKRNLECENADLKARLREADQKTSLALQGTKGPLEAELAALHQELDKAGMARREKQDLDLDLDDDSWWDVEDGADGEADEETEDQAVGTQYIYREKSAVDRVRSLKWSLESKVENLETQLKCIREVVDKAQVPTSYEHSETWANGEVRRCMLPLDLPDRVKRLVDRNYKPRVLIDWPLCDG